MHASGLLLKKKLWHRSFSVNFAKFLRTSFLQNTSELLHIYHGSFWGTTNHSGLSEWRVHDKRMDKCNNPLALRLCKYLDLGSNIIANVSIFLWNFWNCKYVMRCAIWYHLHNLKNVKKPDGGVVLLVTKSNTPPWVFFTFFNCTNGTTLRNASNILGQIVQA